ncbi:prenyltransferase [Planctomycetes bacterium Pla163]|uniref:Prenyltransferase n=1 Tax=Rohdeia mirabilis TaxID=2528008 RepID=A0A518D0K9_9BACT|nr:prenyltransferase [Planctomycetes bacterium Pla163]
MSRALAVGRLVRLSLLPSALADALCGLAIGAGGWPGVGGVLALVASASLFHGGMALNDWADRDEDARVRPDRPIPSGRVGARWALLLAIALLGGGVGAAASVSRTAGLVAGFVAATVVVYDLWGRGPVRGPLLLATCRAGDLALGVAIGAALTGVEFPVAAVVPALVYAAYVFTVSRLGRLEDDVERDPGARPRALLLLLATLLVVGPIGVLAAGLAEHWAWVIAGALVAGAGASGLVRESFARSTWTRGEVMRAMGLALRRLALFTCALTFAVGEPVLGAAILLAYPLGVQLRRVFPPS